MKEDNTQDQNQFSGDNFDDDYQDEGYSDSDLCGFDCLREEDIFDFDSIDFSFEMPAW